MVYFSALEGSNRDRLVNLNRREAATRDAGILPVLKLAHWTRNSDICFLAGSRLFRYSQKKTIR